VTRLARQLRLFPRQFWLLVGGTFFYLTTIALAFPFTAILIRQRLGVSMAVVGLIMGGTAAAGLPLQPLAGMLSDRFGRRAVMIVCAACSGCMYGGLAFAHGLVAVCVVVFCDRALGWPLFLTASNAMVADLVRPRLRPEGYSVVRLMIGAGEVVGPLIAALLLLAGLGKPSLFVLAGGGCFAFLGFTLVALRETRPRGARHVHSDSVSEGAPVYGVRDVIHIPARRRSRRRRAAGRQGRRGVSRERYGVLGDRRFVAFCLVSLLPLFCFGQMYSTFPVMVTHSLRVPDADWGLLMSYSALVIVVTQYPSVRAVRCLSPMYQVALASLLFCGVGLSAFVPASWPLLLTVAALSVAQALFGPVTSAFVARLAPVELRGRYMGAWTLVWTAGQAALGPIFGGLMLTAFGVHATYGVIVAMGLAGAVVYPLLRSVPVAAERNRGPAGEAEAGPG
jgi:MFS family permease